MKRIICRCGNIVICMLFVVLRHNQINGIAPKYWDAFKELALGTKDYAENKITNEILC